MLGAMLGDIAGSRFEFSNNRTKPKELFTDECFPTDDSYMTAAVFQALFLVDRVPGRDLTSRYLRQIMWAVRFYPDAGWGLKFIGWIRGVMEENGISLIKLDIPNKIKFTPNDSAGNGSAMKVSPIPYFSTSMEQCKDLTHEITRVTHDHPDSYKAAECLTTSMYMALHGKTRDQIRQNILSYYPEVAEMTYEKLNKEYQYTELAKDTVPQAMVCFLQSKSFEDALKMAVSIGGDADTLGAIAGALSESFYGWTEETALKYWSLIVPSEHSEPKYHPDDRGVRYFLMKVCDEFPDKFPRLEQMPWTWHTN